MIIPQLLLPLGNPWEEIFVDSFAGGGGASTGIGWALGRYVDYCLNHAWDAMAMHLMNHPQSRHFIEDIFKADPWTVCQGRKVGGAWFSPDCTHHSKAKGGKPLKKKIRGLAWVILMWVKYGVRCLYMENVEEIKKWGPLLHHPDHAPDCDCGKPCGRPDPKHIGRTWKAFLSALGTGLRRDHPDMEEILAAVGQFVSEDELVMGFKRNTEVAEIRACDFGSPTIRKRLFLISRNDGRPIVWPKPTHSRDPGAGLLPWRTAAECIDWSVPVHSIFLTREQARPFRCKRPLVTSTLRRIAVGIDRHVLKSKRPFLVNLTHQGSDRVESLGDPFNVITGAKRGEKSLVAPLMTPRYDDRRKGRRPRSAPIDQPIRTIDTEAHVGNMATATLAPVITEHANASHPRSWRADEALRTQCSEVKGGHFALIAGSMIQTGYGEKKGQSPRALDINKPLGTLVGSEKHAPIAASMVKLRGKNIGNPVTGPVDTISAGGERGGTHHGVVATSLIRHFGQSVGQPVDKPAPTAMEGGGGKTGLLAACLAQHNGGPRPGAPAHPVTDPISAITTTGSQQQIIAASMANYYGTDKDGFPCTDPAHSLRTKDHMGVLECPAVHPLTPEQEAGARRVAAFLREYGILFDGEFATVGEFVLIDIGMRMLTSRELFNAQGFPSEYVIDRGLLYDKKTGLLREIKFTKEQQVRFVGNSVCPQVAEALVRANNPEMCLALAS